MFRRILISILLVALLAAGCADDDSATDERPAASDQESTTTDDAAPTEDTTTTSAAVPPALPVEWEPCGSVECGTVSVPIDYADPEGETIDLALARRPAADPDARIGSLLVNPGGPAVPGVEIVQAGGFTFSSEVLDRFDIVSWDPRGVGKSAPLACGSHDSEYLDTDPTPDDTTEEETLVAVARDVAGECGDADEAFIPFIGTTQGVDDLDRIRQALGDEELTYVGYSYGTLIGEMYAERYPDRVRAIVLDGVVDPSHDLAETARGQAEGIERTFDEILASCGRDPSCPLDDAASSFEAVRATLEEGGASETGPAELQLASVLATYDVSLWPQFLEALAAAESGDYSGIEAMAESYLDIGRYSPYAAILCVDFPPPSDFDAFAELAEEIEASAPRLGGSVAFELLPCAYWPAEPTREPAEIRAEGAAPILVVGNTGDAATPYEQAEAVADALESGVLLTLEGEGHTSNGDPCIDGWVATYLVDLELPPDDTVC